MFVGGRTVTLVGECRAFLESGSEHRMPVSARTILAYLQLSSSNHEDWKDVQPRSGIEKRRTRQRVDKKCVIRTHVYIVGRRVVGKSTKRKALR